MTRGVADALLHVERLVAETERALEVVRGDGQIGPTGEGAGHRLLVAVRVTHVVGLGIEAGGHRRAVGGGGHVGQAHRASDLEVHEHRAGLDPPHRLRVERAGRVGVADRELEPAQEQLAAADRQCSMRLVG